jgi:hypothetical protein
MEKNESIALFSRVFGRSAKLDTSTFRSHRDACDFAVFLLLVEDIVGNNDFEIADSEIVSVTACNRDGLLNIERAIGALKCEALHGF